MKRSKDPLLAAITTYLKPVMTEAGFKRLSRQSFARISNDILQHVSLGRSSWGSKLIKVSYGSMITTYKHTFIGGIDGTIARLTSSPSAPSLWSARTHETADTAMQDIVQQFRVVAQPYFFRTNSPQKLAMEIKKNAYPGGHAYFKMGCCFTTIGHLERALSCLEEAGILYREDYKGRQAQWLIDHIEMTDELLLAIKAGTHQETLSKWKAATIENLKLQTLMA